MVAKKRKPITKKPALPVGDLSWTPSGITPESVCWRMVNSENESITVAGVTFSARHVKSAVLEIDGREVVIGSLPEQSPKFALTPYTVTGAESVSVMNVS